MDSKLQQSRRSFKIVNESLGIWWTLVVVAVINSESQYHCGAYNTSHISGVRSKLRAWIFENSLSLVFDEADILGFIIGSGVASGAVILWFTAPFLYANPFLVGMVKASQRTVFRHLVNLDYLNLGLYLQRLPIWDWIIEVCLSQPLICPEVLLSRPRLMWVTSLRCEWCCFLLRRNVGWCTLSFGRFHS